MERLLHSRESLPRPKDGAALRFLYRTVPGRALLRLLYRQPINRFNAE